MLRAAEPLDAGRAGALLSEFAEDTEWMPRLHSAAEDVAFAAQMIERGWVTVAGRMSEVEAFLAQNGETIHALYVTALARRSGLGSALLSHAQQGVSRLSLWTFQANEPAQAFYERQGFTAVERTDGSGNDEKLPDIRYVWETR